MTISTEILRKVTINLFAKDVAWFERRYPPGEVHEAIRRAIRFYILSREAREREDEDE